MRKRLVIGLGVLLVLTVGVSLAFASDSSPEKEPVSSPFFEATLEQAVSELDGQARAPAAGAAQAPGAVLPPMTSSPDVFPECFTQASAYFPSCHFTTDPQQPDCSEPYPTKDYTWDPGLWADCGPDYTMNPDALYCDPKFTSDASGATRMCDPTYTHAPAGAAGDPWCNPMYTWEALQFPECPTEPPYYTSVTGTWPECEGSQEYTLDPYRWSECHFTSDSLVWPQCVPSFPTQDYTSSPTLWPWCPGPEYTQHPQAWPWCNSDPNFTNNPDQDPLCSPTYTQVPGDFARCDPAFTTDPSWGQECHYTSQPVKWPECGQAWPTKDYTRDHNIWPECDAYTQDTAVWGCPPNPDYTYYPDIWPWCSPAWTSDVSTWPECAPGYTYEPRDPDCSGGTLYTDDPTIWQECRDNKTADPRIWPICHFTSDPKEWQACRDDTHYATQDYTTDPKLWPECDTPEPRLGDLGDAPDRTNHFGVDMTTYPAVVSAIFPTVFDTATGIPPGPKHWHPKKDAWLGPDVGVEHDADLKPDLDAAVTNIGPPANAADRDAYDDGVKMPLALPDCTWTVFTYTVTITPGAPVADRYVNAWFDWNRDGDWQDTVACPQVGPAHEWAVQNQIVTVGPGTWVFSTPAFLPQSPAAAAAPYIWMRISIANRPAPIVPGTNFADGRGPTSGYKLGETEDYYFQPTCPPPVADFNWDPPTICPTTTVYFWDQSTGFPTTWDWDFGDSTGSTAQNPSHVFPGIGTYGVTLTVTNPCDTDTITKKVEVVDCPDDQEDYDVWLKDTFADDGSVPSTGDYWLSPDIWVRNSDDNGIVHQNPIPGTTNYIYVKVRNRLTTTVEDITVNVYWANANIGLGWPGSWSFANSFFITSLAGGAEQVKSVPWNTPASDSHFCLTARIDAPKDPVDSGPDTVVIRTHPPNNNNMAQKNLTLFSFPEVKECGFYTSTVYTEVVFFDAHNSKTSPQKVDIVIDSNDYPLGGSGQLILDPGSLWMDWASLTNFDQVGNTLVPNAFPASMNDVQMAGSETVRMTMTVGAELDAAFTIDVTELVNDVEVGGIQYVRDLPRCIYLPVIMKGTTP